MVGEDRYAVHSGAVQQTLTRFACILCIKIEHCAPRWMFDMEGMEHSIRHVQHLCFGGRNRDNEMSWSVPRSQNQRDAGHDLLFVLNQFDASFEGRKIFLGATYDELL